MVKSDEDAAPHGARSMFPALLKHWRTVRGLSQFALADEAGMSTRHLSFLETGRSHPGRDIVLRLADGLGLASADADNLLLSAGYAPDFAEDSATTEEVDRRRAVLELVLSQHRGVPALVIDAAWDIRLRNATAARVFALFRPHYRVPDHLANNALHILCHPDGLRQFMPDWTAYAEPFIREIDREAYAGGGGAAVQLRAALQAYPGIAEIARLDGRDDASAHAPATLRLRIDEVSLSFVTAFTTFALPFAMRPQYVKIECLYPADQPTARTVAALDAAA